ncbi:DUF1853 family protein [Psychroflexus aurantiacus]|nr:DUF1853 family protein [Psychroflexus aurantiacus]
MKTKLMINQLPGSSIPTFEFELPEELRQVASFPYDEARLFRFLGKRAEIFFKYYLSLSNRYDEIAYSLQIMDDKITIGEFDFLCRDLIQNEILQVELVNKIYLYDDNLHENPDYCWIGPNRLDRFLDKIEKLKSQQFPLLYHPKAESTFRNLEIDPWKVKQRICFKSILFIPEHCHTRFFTTNLEAIAGYFYTLNQFLNKNWKHQSFFIPRKINWFTDETQHTNWYSYAKVLVKLQEFMENKQSVMLFRRNKKGETYKFFVVWW